MDTTTTLVEKAWLAYHLTQGKPVALAGVKE